MGTQYGMRFWIISAPSRCGELISLFSTSSPLRGTASPGPISLTFNLLGCSCYSSALLSTMVHSSFLVFPTKSPHQWRPPRLTMPNYAPCRKKSPAALGCELISTTFAAGDLLVAPGTKHQPSLALPSVLP